MILFKIVPIFFYNSRCILHGIPESRLGIEKIQPRNPQPYDTSFHQGCWCFLYDYWFRFIQFIPGVWPIMAVAPYLIPIDI